MAHSKLAYKSILEHEDSFRVDSLCGVDAFEDGIIEDFKGKKFQDLPTSYILGDSHVVAQSLPKTVESFLSNPVDLDKMYPYAEYYLNDANKRWVRKIGRTVMNK